jgi:hypothetical protein
VSNNVKPRFRLIRFFAGLGGLVLLVFACFALIIPRLHFTGATAAELRTPLPGDELLDRPSILWDHGLTVRAPAQRVWPWIAQLGDRRGGFYSYTFIENLVAGERMYVNASRILPEYQDPRPGTQLIEGFLKVRQVEPGRFLLGEAVPELGIGWTWIWAIEPEGAEATRLHVRTRIQPVGEIAEAPVALGFLIDTGGLVMQRKMLSGLRLRAEGRIERSFVQPLEIAAWFLALGLGVAAGVRYVRVRAWWKPLAVAVSAVLALFLFTFVQPPLWLRLLLDAALALGLWRSWGERARAAGIRT